MTFIIYLPVSKTDGVVVPVAEDQIQPGTKTVLLVDDEAMILEVCADAGAPWL